MNCEQSVSISYGEIADVALAALRRCPDQGSIAVSGKPLFVELHDTKQG